MTTGSRDTTETFATGDAAFAAQPPHQATRHGKKGFAGDLIASIRRLLDEATATPNVRLPRSSGYPY